MIYYIDGTGGPIVTSAPSAMGAVWNPSGTRSIRVVQAALLMRDFDVPDNTMYLGKISVRGTPGSTVTPDADNAEDGLTGPASGFLVDLAEYTVQPTISGDLYSPFAFPVAAAGAEGSGFVLPIPRGVLLGPSQGLGIFYRISATFGGTWDINFVVDD